MTQDRQFSRCIPRLRRVVRFPPGKRVGWVGGAPTVTRLGGGPPFSHGGSGCTGRGSPCSLRALSADSRLCSLLGSPLSARARWLFLSFLQPILLFRILLPLVLWERFAGVRTVANAIWWGSSKPPLFPPPRSPNLLIYPFFLILALFLFFVKIFSIPGRL